MASNENFGIMDQGYFVPRTEILAWINDLLKINLTKIQELGSGAVYCQIIDAIYPGKVAMSKVNWRAKNDYEFIANYKALQNAFEKLGIKRYIEVQKLSKAKYQDNLEFIQWLKRYFDVNCADKGANYPAEDRRGAAKIDFGFAEKVVVPKSYNAGGQVIPNKRIGSKEKRTETGTSGQKESAKRLASPANQKKERPKNASNQKKGSTIEHKESKEIFKKPPHPSSHLPPTPSASSNQRTRVQTKPETAEESYRPSKATAEQLQRYKKIVRDLQAKLEMIGEITQAGDDAQTKLKLIEQVLSIGFSKFQKVTDFSPSNQDLAFKHIDTIKTEEIREEINSDSHVYHHGEHTPPQEHEEQHNKSNASPSEEEAF